MGVAGNRDQRAIGRRLDAVTALAVITAMSGASACEGPVSERPSLAKNTFALATPGYGQTVTIDFKTDAAGTPLVRATVLAEQYAAAGIHFQGGFILGDRTVDFSDYHTAAPDNMICAVPRTDGRCAGGATLSSSLRAYSVRTLACSRIAAYIVGCVAAGSSASL